MSHCSVQPDQQNTDGLNTLYVRRTATLDAILMAASPVLIRGTPF